FGAEFALTAAHAPPTQPRSSRRAKLHLSVELCTPSPIVAKTFVVFWSPRVSLSRSLARSWPPGLRSLRPDVVRRGPSVRCPSCAFENPADSRFCFECGAPLLPLVCDQCGAELPPSVKFCNRCGKPAAET